MPRKPNPTTKPPETYHTVSVRFDEEEMSAIKAMAERFGSGSIRMSYGGVLRVLVAEAKKVLAEKGAVITRDSRLRVVGGGRFLREAPREKIDQPPRKRFDLERGTT